MDVLLIKTSGGRILLVSKTKGDYPGYIQSKAADLIADIFPGESLAEYACCDAASYTAAVKAGKVLQTDGAMPVDFDVCSKADALAASKTILVKQGQDLNSINSNDLVVCHG